MPYILLLLLLFFLNYYHYYLKQSAVQRWDWESVKILYQYEVLNLRQQTK